MKISIITLRGVFNTQIKQSYKVSKIYFQLLLLILAIDLSNYVCKTTYIRKTSDKITQP